MLVTIQSPADARRLVRFLQPFGRLRAAVRLPHVSPVQSARWERDLNRSLDECGCTQGALCSLTALVASIAWQVVYASGFDWRWFLIRVVVAMFAAGAVGKLSALAWARIRIARVVHEIRAFAPTGDAA
jgi:hypothetical protein